MRAWLLCVPLILLPFAHDAGAAAPAKKPPPAASKEDVALAKRVCDMLQGQPAERRAACCHTSGGDLSAVCTGELGAAIARGTVKLDAKRLDACAAATTSALEGCGWVGPLLPKPPAECVTLIAGALAAGQVCHSSLECADGLHCAGIAPGGTGTCAPPIAVGGRCEHPADNLVSFARADDDPHHPVCAGACLKGQCLALVAEGGTCPSNAACAQGLNCIGGKCTKQALPALGASCSGSVECGGGAVCASGKCIKPKDAGESCKLPFECRSLACDKPPGAVEGKCTDVCGTPASNPLGEPH